MTEEIQQQPVASAPAPWPPEAIGGVRLLHPTVSPARSKPWGCAGCKLFQYAPCFTKADREEYTATLDPARREKKNNSYQMDGVGPAHARVMVVLDSPSADEDRYGETACGAGARLVRKFLRAGGVDPDLCYFTYAVRCRAPDDGLDFKAAAYCSKFLSMELAKVQPDIVVALGSLPTKILLGKSDASVDQYNGVATRATVAGREVVVYPLWSPGYVARNDYLSPKYAESFVELGAFVAGKRHIREDGSIYELVPKVDDAIALCRRLLAKVESGELKKLDVDLETSGLNPYLRGQRISVVSLCDTEERGYAVPYDHDEVKWSDEERWRFVEEGLRPLLTHPAVRLRWHNGKFDYKWIWVHMGFWPRDIAEDTMLAHYASDENIEHGLKPLSLRYTDMGDYDAELDRYLSANFPSDSPRYDLCPWWLVGKYAAMDTVATRKLSRAVRAQIRDQDDPFVHALAYRVLPAYSAAVTRVEDAGCHIDVEFAKASVPFFEENERKSWAAITAEPMVRQFCRDREQLAREKIAAGWKVPKEGSKRKMKTLADLPPVEERRYFEFSLDSPPQMQELLFGEKYYNHPVIAYSDSGAPSTDKETMNALATEHKSPIAKRIVEFRLDSKLLGGYVRPTIESCEAQIHPRLHPSLLVHGTVTGRLSCKAPNLQNIPNKGAGYIKRMFVSRYGDEGCIIQADYSQIELRILACISNDRGMIDAFIRGEDLHEITAALLTDMPLEQFKAMKKTAPKEYKILRTIAKRINFGIPYGVGGPGISGMLGGEGIDRSDEVCTGYIEKFFREKPRVKRWIDLVQEANAKDAISRSLFGRARRLEQVRSSINSTVARAQRQAVNHPIQSTAGDMTLSSMVLMDQEICLRAGWDPTQLYPTIEPMRGVERTPGWEKVHLILSVHDSIVFDCHRSMGPATVEMCQRVMPNIIDLAPRVWGDVVVPNLDCLRKVPMQTDVEVGPTYRDAVGVKGPGDVRRQLYVGDRKKEFFDKTPKGEWNSDMDKEHSGAYDAAHGGEAA